MWAVFTMCKSIGALFGVAGFEVGNAAYLGSIMLARFYLGGGLAV